MRSRLIPLFCAATMVLAANGEAAPRRYPLKPVVRSYLEIAQSVANMVGDRAAQRYVQAKKLGIVNVMWEDTGRYQGSSVGPNISDVTIEVEAEGRDGHKQRFLMPVIRYPNFTDKTGDVDIDKFFIRVGNHKQDGKLESVSLRQFLAHPARYMSLPGVGKIKGNSLLADRDEHILTSAQAAFLPVRSQGKARFWPVIFNYQSYAKNPAVLTLLVTRQGTSMTVIDNNRDTVGGGASWGQRLYFNAGGERAPLTAERLTDVMNKGTTSNGESAASLGKDSAAVIANNMDEAVDIANEFAPEHLQLMVAEPETILPQLRNAGAVFVGSYTPVALGDYYAGPSHVLPTSGTGKFFSGLSVYDFLKRTSLISYDQQALAKAAPDVEILAKAEGLDMHRRSVTLRTDKKAT